MPPTQVMYVEPIFLPLIPSSMTRDPSGRYALAPGGLRERSRI